MHIEPDAVFKPTKYNHGRFQIFFFWKKKRKKDGSLLRLLLGKYDKANSIFVIDLTEQDKQQVGCCYIYKFSFYEVTCWSHWP